MPHFSFYQCLDDRRVELASVELTDGEAARDFGIELAEKILRAQDTGGSERTSRIVVCDAEGADLDTIISESF